MPKPLQLRRPNTENWQRVYLIHPRSHVLSLSTYVKDVVNFLQIDGLRVQERALLVTVDMKALYSLFPHDMGVSII